MGATIVVEPDLKVGGLITFKNGKQTFFRNKFFDINRLASLEIGRDKHATTFFLRSFGFKAPEEFAFLSNLSKAKSPTVGGINEAIKFANDIGYPVIVKPNSLTKGTGVAKVYSDAELVDAAQEAFLRDDVALVQRFYPLSDYRIVVYDDRIITVLQRIPLNVTGDGLLTVRELLERKRSELASISRDAHVDIEDRRIAVNLARRGTSLESIVADGERIQLLDNANVSAGGESIVVTDRIHKKFAALAIDVTKMMNLRLCGVDLLTKDISSYSDDHIFLEINGAPAMGSAGEHVVEELYLDILSIIESQ
jgi:D-alanine-D-alanine ligase-like ATP-grasp enzyme